MCSRLVLSCDGSTMEPSRAVLPRHTDRTTVSRPRMRHGRTSPRPRSSTRGRSALRTKPEARDETKVRPARRHCPSVVTSPRAARESPPRHISIFEMLRPPVESALQAAVRAEREVVGRPALSVSRLGSPSDELGTRVVRDGPSRRGLAGRRPPPHREPRRARALSNAGSTAPGARRLAAAEVLGAIGRHFDGPGAPSRARPSTCGHGRCRAAARPTLRRGDLARPGAHRGGPRRRRRLVRLRERPPYTSPQQERLPRSTVPFLHGAMASAVGDATARRVPGAIPIRPRTGRSGRATGTRVAMWEKTGSSLRFEGPSLFSGTRGSRGDVVPQPPDVRDGRTRPRAHDAAPRLDGARALRSPQASSAAAPLARRAWRADWRRLLIARGPKVFMQVGHQNPCSSSVPQARW